MFFSQVFLRETTKGDRERPGSTVATPMRTVKMERPREAPLNFTPIRSPETKKTKVEVQVRG